MEEKLRKDLVEYGNKLVETGLVQGTWGNLSLRLDEEHMLVTPSGLDYTRLTPAHMVKVNINTLEYEGDLKPTSEKGLHAIIYAHRPEVKSVIHTHATNCSIFAAARKDVIINEEELIKIFGKEVKCAKYGLPGTKNLMKNTSSALGNGFGCIMAGHGMICCGESIEAAFKNCLLLEDYCKRYIEGGLTHGY